MSALSLPAPKRVLMPVGPITPAQVRDLCRVERKREFETHATAGQCVVRETKSWPYKGAYKTWFKLTNEAYITSYAVVSENMVTLHHAIQPTVTHRAPAGMRFAVDGNGLHLKRQSDWMDYHPTFTEWYSLVGFAGKVRKGMAENFKRRQALKKTERLNAANKKQAERIAKIMARDLMSTRVTLEDSRRAGNCVEGSLAFAERKLGISRAEILAASHLLGISAQRLLTVANGDRPKVEAAIKIAWLRETAVSI